MVSTSILSSSVLSFHPFPGSSKHGLHDPKRASRTRIFASRKEAHDQNHSSRMVDENMIVLRKRIHEMKMVERNYEPPSDWMDWEKRIYTSYDSFICGVMGFLQSQMMNSRPSLTLGMLVLIILSVPTSAAVVFFHLMEIIPKGILAGIHHI
ncbi:uncharacterized protein LOC108979706 [Juglans regia]|uniref:Uncharacterized protein LOC108979706 n=1 Tax=Juglans regia TaxID=51240 RepID=A0A2I4DFR0_JUGRE|nr:uncharacterized protein LOC108979706 [Juglans regia]